MLFSTGEERLYWMDSYGSVVRKVERSAEGFAELTSTSWDPLRLRSSSRRTPDGLTRFGYDEFGNATERRFFLPARTPESPQGEEVAVEKWGHDPAFSKETCHVDSEGKVTVTLLDSDGADPRARRPVGSGLTLKVTAYRNPVATALVGTSATCEDLAALVSPSADDQITELRYCGVAGAGCPPGKTRGDHLETRVGRRKDAKLSKR